MGWVLAMDIGNTVTRLAVMNGGAVGPIARLPTEARDFPELVTRLAARLASGEGQGPAAIGISCVVPDRAGTVERVAQDLGAPMVAVGPEASAGLASSYRPPDSLGPDRIANAVAARERFGAPCIAVDLGTALTMEVVDAEGGLRGGLLFPGLEAAARGIDRTTAGVAIHRPGPWDSVIGDSTSAGLAAGLAYGFPALIDGLLERVRDELGTRAPSVLTGGGVRRLAAMPERVQTRDPHLTLRGVALIAIRSEGLEPGHSGR